MHPKFPSHKVLSLQSRPIFNKSTRFEDMRNVEEERVPYRRPMVKKYFPIPLHIYLVWSDMHFDGKLI